MSTETPAYELTRNPVDGSWGFICREHGLHRSGLAEAHAINVERKHIREDHADQTLIVLDVSRLADMVLAQTNQAKANVAWACWTALTGVTDVSDAVSLAGEFAGRGIQAAVVPF